MPKRKHHPDCSNALYPERPSDNDKDGIGDNADLDDDNDGNLDDYDSCPTGVIGEILDQDNDGCDDISEDLDLDGFLPPSQASFTSGVEGSSAI